MTLSNIENAPLISKDKKSKARKAVHRPRGILAACLLAAVLGTACAPAHARVAVAAPLPNGVAVIKVKRSPPPPRRQVVVVKPSKRHVWVKGHHVWRPKQERWIWVEGRWLVPPRGKRVWIAPTYERRGGGWVFTAGYWR